MRFLKAGNVTIVRIDKGEKIIESLMAAIREESIVAGFFTGIGAVSRCSLKYFSMENREYIEQNFQGDWEIASLTGNITLHDGAPFIHAHCVISDGDMQARGGHLAEGIAGATCEIFIITISADVRRKKDEETQLNLLDL